MKTLNEIQSILAEKLPVGLVLPEHTQTGHFYRYTPKDELYGSVTTKAGILEAPHLKKWAASLAVDYIDSHLGIITESNKAEIYAAAIMAHQDAFEDAGDIGTEGHGVIEDYLKEWMSSRVRPSDITKFIKGQDSRLWAIARSAELFCKDFDVVPIASEMKVASAKYKYGGTLDSLMFVAFPKLGFEGDPRCQHSYWWLPNPKRELEDVCVQCNRKRKYEFCLVDWKTSNSIDKAEYAMQTSAYWEALKEMCGLKPKYIIIVKLDKGQARYGCMLVKDRVGSFKAFRRAAWIYDWLTSGEEVLAPLVSKERINLSTFFDHGTN